MVEREITPGPPRRLVASVPIKHETFQSRVQLVLVYRWFIRGRLPQEAWPKRRSLCGCRRWSSL